MYISFVVWLQAIKFALNFCPLLKIIWLINYIFFIQLQSIKRVCVMEVVSFKIMCTQQISCFFTKFIKFNLLWIRHISSDNWIMILNFSLRLIISVLNSLHYKNRQNSISKEIFFSKFIKISPLLCYFKELVYSYVISMYLSRWSTIICFSTLDKSILK